MGLDRDTQVELIQLTSLTRRLIFGGVGWETLFLFQSSTKQ